jgi:hypothetical protein
MAGVGKAPTEGDLNDVFEVELNFIGRQRIGKPIERLLQLCFEIFEDVYDSFNSRLVDHTARPIDEQTYIVVKLNVWRQFHRSSEFSHKAAPAASTIHVSGMVRMLSMGFGFIGFGLLVV